MESAAVDADCEARTRVRYFYVLETRNKVSTGLALTCMFGLFVVFVVLCTMTEEPVCTEEHDHKIKKKPNPKVISYADMPISAILCIAAANSKPKNQKYLSDWADKQLQWEREQQNDSQ